MQDLIKVHIPFNKVEANILSSFANRMLVIRSLRKCLLLQENASHPPTPASVAPSPSASMSSVHDEFENISSPSWPGTPVSVAPTAPTVSVLVHRQKPGLEILLKIFKQKLSGRRMSMDIWYRLCCGVKE